MAASGRLNHVQWLKILSTINFLDLLVSGGSYWPLTSFVRDIDTMIMDVMNSYG